MREEAIQAIKQRVKHGLDFVTPRSGSRWAMRPGNMKSHTVTKHALGDIRYPTRKKETKTRDLARHIKITKVETD